jgi:hypothetical protein
MSKKNRYNITLSKDLEYYIDKLIKTIGLSRFIEEQIRRHTGIIEAEELSQQLENIENQKLDLSRLEDEIRNKLESNQESISEQTKINDLINETKELMRIKKRLHRKELHSKEGIRLTDNINSNRQSLSSLGVDMSLLKRMD